MSLEMTLLQMRLVRELLVTNPIQPQMAEEVGRLLAQLQKEIDAADTGDNGQ